VLPRITRERRGESELDDANFTPGKQSEKLLKRLIASSNNRLLTFILRREARNRGDHAFVVLQGTACFPEADQHLISADAGSSFGHQVRLWKVKQAKSGLVITASHLSAEESKWIKIAHRCSAESP
jgi:hypothetical protein